MIGGSARGLLYSRIIEVHCIEHSMDVHLSKACQNRKVFGDQFLDNSRPALSATRLDAFHARCNPGVLHVMTDVRSEVKTVRIDVAGRRQSHQCSVHRWRIPQLSKSPDWGYVSLQRVTFLCSDTERGDAGGWTQGFVESHHGIKAKG